MGFNLRRRRATHGTKPQAAATAPAQPRLAGPPPIGSGLQPAPPGSGGTPPLLECSGVLEPNSYLGDWVTLATGGLLTVRVTCAIGPPLTAHAATEEGEWIPFPNLSAAGGTATLQLPPGRYYICLKDPCKRSPEATLVARLLAA